MDYKPEDNDDIRHAVFLYSNNRIEGINQYGPMSSWNTVNITDMSSLFDGYIFRNDEIDTITDWDTRNVNNMNATFKSCVTFDQVLNWDTSSVIEMEYMFDGCIAYNSPLGETFNNNTVNLESMEGMFQNCSSLNQSIHINTANVYSMKLLFSGCTDFNSPFGDNFMTDEVTDMTGMFYNCSNFNQPLDFNTSNVQSMPYMFSGCTIFNPDDLPGSRVYQPQNISIWDVRNVIDMRNMFENCRLFNKPLDEWQPLDVIDTSYMFSGCHAFNQPLNNWELPSLHREGINQVSISDTMFYDCRNFNKDLAPVYPDGYKLVKEYITYDEIIETELPELEQGDPIQIRDTDTVFDFLEDVESNLYEKIRDGQSVVFYYNNRFYLFDRTKLDINCKSPEYIKYECYAINHISLVATPTMYNGTHPYLTGNSIGIPVDFLHADQVKKVVYSRYPIIRIVEEEQTNLLATVSLSNILYKNAMSVSHCQERTGGKVFTLVACRYDLQRRRTRRRYTRRTRPINGTRRHGRR